LSDQKKIGIDAKGGRLRQVTLRYAKKMFLNHEWTQINTNAEVWSQEGSKGTKTSNIEHRTCSVETFWVKRNRLAKRGVLPHPALSRWERECVWPQ
jgi:hypothetical protein